MTNQEVIMFKDYEIEIIAVNQAAKRPEEKYRPCYLSRKTNKARQAVVIPSGMPISYVVLRYKTWQLEKDREMATCLGRFKKEGDDIVFAEVDSLLDIGNGIVGTFYKDFSKAYELTLRKDGRLKIQRLEVIREGEDYILLDQTIFDDMVSFVKNGEEISVRGNVPEDFQPIAADLYGEICQK